MKTLLLAMSLISFHSFAQGLVKVSDLMITLVPPTSPNTSGFMTVKNESNRDVRIVRVESEIAGSVEIHQMKKENGLMKMRQVEKFLIEKGKTVELDGAYHIMFMGLKKPVKAGESHKLMFYFDDGSKIESTATVKSND